MARLVSLGPCNSRQQLAITVGQPTVRVSLRSHAECEPQSTVQYRRTGDKPSFTGCQLKLTVWRGPNPHAEMPCSQQDLGTPLIGAKANVEEDDVRCTRVQPSS